MTAKALLCFWCGCMEGDIAHAYGGNCCLHIGSHIHGLNSNLHALGFAAVGG